MLIEILEFLAIFTSLLGGSYMSYLFGKKHGAEDVLEEDRKTVRAITNMLRESQQGHVMTLLREARTNQTNAKMARRIAAQRQTIGRLKADLTEARCVQPDNLFDFEKDYRVWDCKIVVDSTVPLPDGFDSTPRFAAQQAIEDVLGYCVIANFSGWGGKLNAIEQEIVANREIR